MSSDSTTRIESTITILKRCVLLIGVLITIGAFNKGLSVIIKNDTPNKYDAVESLCLTTKTTNDMIVLVKNIARAIKEGTTQ